MVLVFRGVQSIFNILGGGAKQFSVVLRGVEIIFRNFRGVKAFSSTLWGVKKKLT